MNRKMQLISQDRMMVLNYQGVRVTKNEEGQYVVIAFNHTGDKVVGKYASREKVIAIIDEIIYAAGNGRSYYYMPIN